MPNKGHKIAGPLAPAHEILNIPAQEVVTSPNWRKRCQPRRLPPLNQCLYNVPNDLVQDKVHVPVGAYSRKRYRSTHILRKLPNCCVAPYERRRPAGYFAPDHNAMSTEGLVNNLEEIAVHCEVSQAATHIEWAEATYDLNKLAFYQHDVEIFPDYPYMFNQYVVPECPPEGYAEYPPIYTRERIQTFWPKEAAHPSLASKYYGFQDGREEPTNDIELPPRMGFFLAKEGITDIVKRDAIAPQELPKCPVAIRIQPKFLRGSQTEFELLPATHSFNDNDLTFESPIPWREEVRNFLIGDSSSVYDGNDSLFGSLSADVTREQWTGFARAVLLADQGEKIELAKYQEYLRPHYEEFRSLTDSITQQRLSRLRGLAIVVMKLEQYESYAVDEYTKAKEDLKAAVTGHHEATQISCAAAGDDEDKVLQVLLKKLGSIHTRYTQAVGYSFFSQQAVSWDKNLGYPYFLSPVPNLSEIA